MRQGRQIYLSGKEIEHLAGLIESNMIGIDDDTGDLVDSLLWAEKRLESTRLNFAEIQVSYPLLPVTEQASWKERLKAEEEYIATCKRDIEETKQTKLLLQRLLKKLWYYDE